MFNLCCMYSGNPFEHLIGQILPTLVLWPRTQVQSAHQARPEGITLHTAAGRNHELSSGWLPFVCAASVYSLWLHCEALTGGDSQQKRQYAVYIFVLGLCAISRGAGCGWQDEIDACRNVCRRACRAEG